jgi:hypothetical protein
MKMRKRRYIVPGLVESLTSVFVVEKVDDIRLVYTAAESGLNDAMVVPRFSLPTIHTHLRAVEEGTHMADLDVGEMFLNFCLHPTTQPWAGVDLTHFIKLKGGKSQWERWCRSLMGCKSLPYQLVQGISVAEELIRGNPLDTNNLFRWDWVRMNFPGSTRYECGKLWVSKIRADDMRIAADFVSFVDDVRPTGPTKKECWVAARRVGSMLKYLGIQDASRKRRDSSQDPAAWSGSVVKTDNQGVYVLAAEAKWTKAKALLVELRNMMEEKGGAMCRKRLKQIRGFLIYVTRTYPGMVPYLIGCI